MSNPEFMETTILRPTIPLETGERPYKPEHLDKMARNAVEVLIQTYKVEGRSLNLYVPPGDDIYQRKVGGTKTKPVLLGMFSPNGNPLYIPTDQSLIMFRTFPAFVIPLFTSHLRVKNFTRKLMEYNCVIPDPSVLPTPYNHQMNHDIQANRIVVNPIPEFVLSAYMCIGIGSDGRFTMTTIYYFEEDRDISDPFSKFVLDRR